MPVFEFSQNIFKKDGKPIRRRDKNRASTKILFPETFPKIKNNYKNKTLKDIKKLQNCSFQSVMFSPLNSGELKNSTRSIPNPCAMALIF